MIPCLTAFLAVRTQFTVVETITCPENREATIWNHIIALQNVVPLGTIKYCSVVPIAIEFQPNGGRTWRG